RLRSDLVRDSHRRSSRAGWMLIQGGPMKTLNRLPGKRITRCLVVSIVVLAGLAGTGAVTDALAQGTVPRAACGPNDHPETALQGQVPANLRANGFKGFNCNLELIGHSRGDGANWQTPESGDRAGHTCGYHGTGFQTANRTNLGVPVIDATNPANPTPTTYLTTTSMLDPWESLKVNERRQLLGADNGHNGAGGPQVDFYDISADCRSPQLLSSLPVGTGTDGGGVLAPIVGHEGSFAPDGLTYYGGGRTVPNNYYAVDITDPTQPKLMLSWNVPQVASGARTHGLSVSEDGMRGYFVSIGSVTPAQITDPNVAANNGLVV